MPIKTKNLGERKMGWVLGFTISAQISVMFVSLFIKDMDKRDSFLRMSTAGLIVMLFLGLFLYSFFFVLSFWMQVIFFSVIILVGLLFKLAILTKNENIQKAIGYFVGAVVFSWLVAYVACVFHQAGINGMVKGDLF